MRKNLLKEKLQRGEVVYGPFLNCSYEAYIEIIGMAGFDFCVVDMEHGPLSVETAEDLCRAGQGAGLSPIVRVRKNDAPQIQRALDIGSSGVQIPQIETREDGERAVRAAKYAPEGMRGVSFFTRAGDYMLHGSEGLTTGLNKEQIVVIHIEGVPGLENLEEVVQVPGIDVVFLGPYDLSQSMGIPGQINDPRVVQGMEKAVKIIRDSGKAAGTFANDATASKRWTDVGVQYIALGCDVGIFGDACKALVEGARA